MRIAVLALAFVVVPAAFADEWPAPETREVFSRSRAFFVRVIPGKSIGDTVGFNGAPKGSFATAEFYRLEQDRSYRLAATITLLNPVAPVDFFVTDRGFLITLDNWHNLGYGKVVAFYTPDGQPVRSYALSDLFTKAEIDEFRHSVSSIWCWKSSGTYIRPGDETLSVAVSDTGAGFIFEANGAYQYCETREGKFLCRSANEGRSWRAFREPGGQSH